MSRYERAAIYAMINIRIEKERQATARAKKKK